MVYNHLMKLQKIQIQLQKLLIQLRILVQLPIQQQPPTLRHRPILQQLKEEIQLLTLLQALDYSHKLEKDSSKQLLINQKAEAEEVNGMA